ncbi:MAG: glycine cleavage T C-terminal barrel domain-containing protein, partial [Candidatus Hodarchaeales archaeon]
YLITWNAGNLEKIWHWVNEIARLVKSLGIIDFQIENLSNETAMIAFQGPKAPNLTRKLFGVYPGSWKCAIGKYEDIEVLILGSGYTGEAGCEIVIWNTSVEKPHNALKVWEGILDQSNEDGVLACGLGARDTLRMEAGIPLYGNDMDETITPVEAGLAIPALIKLDKPFFIGQDALKIAMDVSSNSKLKRVGIKALKRGPSPRSGMKIFDREKEIGYVSSGAFSPLLKIGIGQAYIHTNYKANTEVVARLGKKIIPVILCKFPLFDQSKYGSRRE